MRKQYRTEDEPEEEETTTTTEAKKEKRKEEEQGCLGGDKGWHHCARRQSQLVGHQVRRHSASSCSFYWRGGAGLSVARFIRGQGAASGFKRVLEVVDCRGRHTCQRRGGWVVEDEEKVKGVGKRGRWGRGTASTPQEEGKPPPWTERDSDRRG